MSDTEEIYDDAIIEGVPEYSKKSEYNKPKQVETVMNRALELRAKSMHPQYVNTSISNDGTVKREVIEDSREAYVNAVSAVFITLSAELNRSKERKVRIEGYEKQKDDIFNNYSYMDFEPFAKVSKGGKWEISKIGSPYIPDYDAFVRIGRLKTYVATNPTAVRGEVELVKGYRNQQNKSYWNEMIKIADKILSELQCLVDELNYFKQESSF